jgi:tetratricopeptide (TPR) repeat protein
MKYLNWTILAILLMAPVLSSKSTLAEPTPLKLNANDPLLPPMLDGKLTPFRERLLRESCEKLNQQAQILLNKAQADKAFTLWYRELNLRHYLGIKEEIESLGRVGKIAWDNNRPNDIKIITKKLQSIQADLENNKQINLQTLDLLFNAFQNVHSLDDLLLVQQRKLDLVEKDSLAQEADLEATAKIYLAKFDFPEAAKIYEILLKKVQSRSDSVKEAEYLQKLTEIYDQQSQPTSSIVNKERLAIIYGQKQQFNLLVSLLISIGNDYRSLKDYPRAVENYQKAFNLAWSLKYLGFAEEALGNIADLYAQNKQFDYALSAYRSLIVIQKKSYNYYGLMQSYDKMGDIYFANQNYNLALDCYKNSLKFAQSLKYQTDVLIKKIQKTQQTKVQKQIKNAL